MRKTVDGFTPKRPSVASGSVPHPTRPIQDIRPIGNKLSQPLKPGHGTKPRRAVRSIDGIISRPRSLNVPKKATATWQARPRVGFDTPTFINDPTVRGEPHTKASRFRRFLAILQYPLVAAVAVLAIYSTTIGQWLVFAYAIYVLMRRIDSRATFIAALMLLIGIPFFQLINQPGVAENTAIYAYELLVVGTLQSIVELMFSRRREKDMAL